MCVAEKRQILQDKSKSLINIRNEFISKCRHKNKCILENLKVKHEVDVLKHTIRHDDVNFDLTQPIIIQRRPKRTKERVKAEADN